MQYTSFSYLWPPRPDNAIGPKMLKVYEAMGFVGQFKKNGTCSVIGISPDKTIKAMNRHNEDHKLWSPTPASSAAFKTLPGKGWYVFVAELLHSKVTGGPRDTNYIFDILVADGEYLIGKTFAERMEILNALFPEDIGEEDSHRIITPNTWVAKTIPTGFRSVFDGLARPEDEGIVLKDPKSKLQPPTRQASNNDWQVKCRRPHKNFSF